MNPRVFMGGRLNEDLEHQEAADVRPMLRAEGIVPCDTVEEMIEHLRRKPTDTGVQIPPTMR